MTARLFLIPIAGFGLFCTLIAIQVGMVVVPTVVRCVVPTVVDAVTSDTSDSCPTPLIPSLREVVPRQWQDGESPGLQAGENA